MMLQINNKLCCERYVRAFSFTARMGQKHFRGSFSFSVNEIIHPSAINHLTNSNSSSESCTSSKTSKKVSSETRINNVNVQMLSKSLYDQIFGNDRGEQPGKDSLEVARKELKKFGLLKEVELLPDVDFKLPRLEGKNIEEHFWKIGQEQSGPYKKLLLDLANGSIPEIPTSWVCQEGWTRYEEGCKPKKVDFPDEDALVLDVEVCVRAGSAPTMATAVSSSAWYGWVCPSLATSQEPVQVHRYVPDMLIPLEGKTTCHGKSRVVVGHNVSYDRARIREQYRLKHSALRFVDTMSMHICIGGVTSYQRAMLKTKVGLDDSDWREYSSLNSLKEVFKLYCKEDLSKEKRNVFLEESMSHIREHFQILIKYCAQDVVATFKVLKKMLPLFFDRFPHPVSLAGMLELSTAYLPINSNWERYLTDAQQTYEDLETECKLLLTRKCDNACKLLHGNQYKQDVWMWDEDWSTQDLTLTKKKVKASKKRKESINIEEQDEEDGLEEKFGPLFDEAKRLPVRRPHLPGYPLWYRKLCGKLGAENWIPGPQLVSTSVKVTPKLLNLTWQGYPLHYTRQHGWGILVPDPNAHVDQSNVPFEKLKQTIQQLNLMRVNSDQDGIFEELLKKVEKSFAGEDYWKERVKNGRENGMNKKDMSCDLVVENCCHFLKLPHKNGAGHNVGNPLSKDFIKNFSSSVLAGADSVAAKVLSIGRMVSYWRNNCERICGQLTVWHEADLGAILPQVVVCGTLTRRAMEPTWMTASNAQTERVGSELRAMVQAPPGYHLVGADVDSQELWIASVMGDAAFAKLHASTPFGWMTLSGNKANGTDMHSLTAEGTSISRDHAKVINYARIYGAGVRFAQRLLQQFNPHMSDTEAKNKATKMFLMTKGRKVFRLKTKFKSQLPDETPGLHTSYSASRLAKFLGKPISEVFEPAIWEGGTESAMFNRLEQVACSPQPRTPFLSARLSRAVEPRSTDDDSFLTTRVNWVVQSGAVDFLHLMLVSVRWLSQGQMRFCLSFHDEVRYLVPSGARYEAALVLHITNLLTRAFCARRLGLHDLPMSVAFFSSVEVDQVLRKEARDDCRTPSNPHGLKKGYGIPPGESLNIYETLSKSGGSLATFQKEPR